MEKKKVYIIYIQYNIPSYIIANVSILFFTSYMMKINFQTMKKKMEFEARKILHDDLIIQSRFDAIKNFQNLIVTKF